MKMAAQKVATIVPTSRNHHICTRNAMCTDLCLQHLLAFLSIKRAAHPARSKAMLDSLQHDAFDGEAIVNNGGTLLQQHDALGAGCVNTAKQRFWVAGNNVVGVDGRVAERETHGAAEWRVGGRSDERLEVCNGLFGQRSVDV